MRFYLSNTAAPITVTGNGTFAWERTSATVNRALTALPTGSFTTVSDSETSSSTTYDVRLLRFVSPPIVKSGTFGGDFEFNFARAASSGTPTANFGTAVSIWVVSSNGATNRGSLFSGAFTNTWDTVQTAEIISQTLTSVAVLAGDRVVVEFGFRARNSSTTSRTGTITYGGGADVNDDLFDGDTGSAVTTYPSYIQFDDAAVDAFFYTADPVRLRLTSAPASANGDPTGGSWDDTTTSSDPWAFEPEPSGAPRELQRTETNATANYDVLLGTWVSEPLTAAVVLPAGDPFNLVFARRSSTGAGLLARYRMYALAPAGNLRGSWFSKVTGSAVFNETAGPVGLAVTSQTATRVFCEAGDRIVLEVGFQQPAATATAATGSIWAGGTSSTDQTAGGTDVDDPGYFEFPRQSQAEFEAAAEPPTVNAGADAEITLGDTFTRTATEDDGGAAITSREWQIVSGLDAGTTIGTAAALSWEPTQPDVYVLRYFATNTAGTAIDDVTVTVDDPGDAPTVSAGPDADVSLGDTLTRTATEDDNGSPITSRRWLIVSGPE